MRLANGHDGLISIICIEPSKGTALSTLFFYSEQDPAELWSAELQSALPSDIRVRIYPDLGDPADVEYVLCWQPKAGLLASFPNLKLILSLAAGFDHVLQDPARPAHVPIVRIIDDTLSTMMSEYAVYAVLGFHRFMPQFQSNQSNKIWKNDGQTSRPTRISAFWGSAP